MGTRWTSRCWTCRQRTRPSSSSGSRTMSKQPSAIFHLRWKYFKIELQSRPNYFQGLTMSGTFIGNSTSIQVLFPIMESFSSQLCRSTDRKICKGSNPDELLLRAWFAECQIRLAWCSGEKRSCTGKYHHMKQMFTAHQKHWNQGTQVRGWTRWSSLRRSPTWTT